MPPKQLKLKWYLNLKKNTAINQSVASANRFSTLRRGLLVMNNTARSQGDTCHNALQLAMSCETENIEKVNIERHYYNTKKTAQSVGDMEDILGAVVTLLIRWRWRRHERWRWRPHHHHIRRWRTHHHHIGRHPHPHPHHVRRRIHLRRIHAGLIVLLLLLTAEL